MSYKHRANNVIAVAAWFGHNDIVVNIISPNKKTVEEGILANKNRNITQEGWYEMHEKTPSDDDCAFVVAELVQRLGLNFSLMMTMLGVRVIGPINSTQQKVDKQNRAVKNDKANSRKKLQSQKLLASTVYLCEFEQNIDFYEVKEAPEQIGKTISGRNSPRPHWRRGHYKMQPYGPQLALRKLTFIKPVLVMSRNFTGDTSSTQVTYTGKNLHS